MSHAEIEPRRQQELDAGRGADTGSLAFYLIDLNGHYCFVLFVYGAIRPFLWKRESKSGQLIRIRRAVSQR